MASSVLHYIISKKVAEQMQIKDTARFLMGAVIAPDTGSKDDGSYHTLHYFEECHHENLRGINWQNFAVDNTGNMTDAYYLGYYCHLIEDSVWYHDFFDKTMRIYPKEIREKKFPIVYRDYWRLNYLLKKELDIPYIPFEKVSIPDASISADRIDFQIENVNKQFEAPSCSKEDLELISWDFIMEYINKCEYLCKNEISALQGKSIHINPQNYYSNSQKDF